MASRVGTATRGGRSADHFDSVRVVGQSLWTLMVEDGDGQLGR